MPRIPPHLLRHAYQTEPLVARLLPVCRTLASASNELRWLREHVEQGQRSPCQRRETLTALIDRRAHGEPLQYILGSEHFGDLEIVCRPGVLIPRQETASSVSHLVRVLPNLLQLPRSQPVRILDLCSGTGCIPLLFHHDFYAQDMNREHRLDMMGVDLSDTALALAEHNRHRQISLRPISSRSHSEAQAALRRLQFVKANVLQSGSAQMPNARSFDQMLQDLPVDHRKFNIVISNPPYVSAHEHKTVTSPSVRKYEPRSALVPEVALDSGSVEDGDQFYPRLWHIADAVEAKVVLFEVGDMRQAMRVADMGREHHGWKHIQIWRDDPKSCSDEVGSDQHNQHKYSMIGEGHARSVTAWR